MKHLSLLFATILFFSACQSGGSAPEAKTSSTASAASAESVDETGLTKTDLGAGYTFGEKVAVNGNIESRGTSLNGKKEGVWIDYHKRSQTRGAIAQTITHYKNGVKHGAQMKVSTSGSIEEIAMYVSGKLEGPYTKYERTSVKEETNYLNGELHGSRKTFYQDGTVQLETNYVNGKREGSEKYYDEEGNVTLEYTYKNGERQ